MSNLSNENIFAYFISINILALILTVYDKWASKNNPRVRISERYLMITAILGGALTMFISMKIIRHKTKHKKFMLVLPMLIIVQFLLLVIILK